jgi:hypothetical protein
MQGVLSHLFLNKGMHRVLAMVLEQQSLQPPIQVISWTCDEFLFVS